MAGEVFQWILDWDKASYVDPCTDCAYLANGYVRVLRGGDYAAAVSDLLPPFRDYDTPVARNFEYGFRCARTP